MRKGRTGPAGQETQDAYFAIEQFTAWINSADTKAGFLSAALAVVVNGIVLASDTGAGGLRHFGGQGPVEVAAFALAALSAAICTGTLVLAIYPRIQQQPYSRYSWPSVAESTPQALAASTSVANRDEAWATARSLALITRAKYRYLRLSFICWIFSLLLLLLAVVVR